MGDYPHTLDWAEESPFGFAVLLENRYAFVNRAYAKMLGCTAEELLNFSEAQVAGLVHPDDREFALQRIERRLKGENLSPSAELRLLHRKGGSIWVEMFSKLIRVGNRPAIQLSVHDITTRKQAEEDLLENESFIMAILDNLHIGIAVNTVTPEVKFSYVSENFLKYYRVNREELVSPDAFWEAVYEDPEYREIIRKKVLDDCASGDPARMFWENIPISRRGGETRYISARNIPVPKKNLMISTVWDVTHHVQTRQELAKHHGRLEEMVSERTDQLNRIVHAMTGRELRMAELKKIVKKLRQQLIEAGITPVADDPLKSGDKGI